MPEKFSEDDDMSPEDRLNWLRSHGIEVETAEERREKASKAVIDKNTKVDDGDSEKVSYILIPHDASKPLKELNFSKPKIQRGQEGKDILVEILKPYFSQASGEELDLELLRETKSGNLLGTDGAPSISDQTLRNVAMEGNVEVFPLVRGLQSNKNNGVNIYLDEIGMLKRLPLNKRAGEYAERAGFNPPPKFYGNVFLGRVKTTPVLQNVSMKLGIDTSLSSAPWLQRATMENLENQMQMNQLTGRNELQPSGPGEDGVDKEEKEGYSWTQIEDEIEVKLCVDSNTKAKDVKVTFHTKSLLVSVHGQDVGINIKLFSKIDADESTWTLDTVKSEKLLVITLIKIDAISWPRIVF